MDSHKDKIIGEALQKRCNKIQDNAVCYIPPPEFGESLEAKEPRRKNIEQSIENSCKRKIRLKETPNVKKQWNEANNLGYQNARLNETPDANKQQNKNEKTSKHNVRENETPDRHQHRKEADKENKRHKSLISRGPSFPNASSNHSIESIGTESLR